MKKPLKTYQFEGEQRTLAQIMAMVPALKKNGILYHLGLGNDTRVKMLSVFRKPHKNRKTYEENRGRL